MTWVLGWPISIEFAVQYGQEHGFVRPGQSPDDLSVLNAVVQDIKKRSGLSKYHIPLLCCWVKDDVQLVYGLSVDHHSRSPRKAEKRLKRKHLPSRQRARRLCRLLGARDGPWWYRYDDGSWDPVDGECFPYEGSDDSDTGSEPDWFPAVRKEGGEKESNDESRGRKEREGPPVERGDEHVKSEMDCEPGDNAPSQQLPVESTARCTPLAQRELCMKMWGCKV